MVLGVRRVPSPRPISQSRTPQPTILRRRRRGGGDDQAPPLGRDESGDGPPDFDPGGPPGGGPPDFGPGGPPGGGPPGFGPGGPPGGGPPGFGGTPGFQRFIRPSLASQITWLFPLAVLGAVSFWFHEVRGSSGQRQRHCALSWGGWLSTHWIVFSFAQGIFHDYYTTVDGPGGRRPGSLRSRFPSLARMVAFGRPTRASLAWRCCSPRDGKPICSLRIVLAPLGLPILAAEVLADVVGLAGFRWAAAGVPMHPGSDMAWHSEWPRCWSARQAGPSPDAPARMG